jgi:hypothetical protein
MTLRRLSPAAEAMTSRSRMAISLANRMEWVNRQSLRELGLCWALAYTWEASGRGSREQT